MGWGPRHEVVLLPRISHTDCRFDKGRQPLRCAPTAEASKRVNPNVQQKTPVTTRECTSTCAKSTARARGPEVVMGPPVRIAICGRCPTAEVPPNTYPSCARSASTLKFCAASQTAPKAKRHGIRAGALNRPGPHRSPAVVLRAQWGPNSDAHASCFSIMRAARSDRSSLRSR